MQGGSYNSGTAICPIVLPLAFDLDLWTADHGFACDTLPSLEEHLYQIRQNVSGFPFLPLTPVCDIDLRDMSQVNWNSNKRNRPDTMCDGRNDRPTGGRTYIRANIVITIIPPHEASKGILMDRARTDIRHVVVKRWLKQEGQNGPWSLTWFHWLCSIGVFF